jgi:hypothetical protein
MAFLMTAGRRTESIGHGEELILGFAARAPGRYPEEQDLRRSSHLDSAVGQTAAATVDLARVLAVTPLRQIGWPQEGAVKQREQTQPQENCQKMVRKPEFGSAQGVLQNGAGAYDAVNHG